MSNFFRNIDRWGQDNKLFTPLTPILCIDFTSVVLSLTPHYTESHGRRFRHWVTPVEPYQPWGQRRSSLCPRVLVSLQKPVSCLRNCPVTISFLYVESEILSGILSRVHRRDETYRNLSVVVWVLGLFRKSSFHFFERTVPVPRPRSHYKVIRSVHK